LIEIKRLRAQGPDDVETVRGEDHRLALVAELIEDSEALLLESVVADRDHLVGHDDVELPCTATENGTRAASPEDSSP